MPEHISLYDVISTLAIISCYVSLFAGLMVVLKGGYGIKAIVTVVMLGAIVNTILTFWKSDLVGAIVSRTFSFFEFALISVFFYSCFKGKAARYGVIVCVILFPLIVALDALTNSQKLRDDLVTVTESIILVGYSVALLYVWMKNIEYESITSAPQFWIVSGILIYFGGCIFVFGSSNYAYTVCTDAYVTVWTIHSAIGIIYYTILTFGFWKARKAYR